MSSYTPAALNCSTFDRGCDEGDVLYQALIEGHMLTSGEEASLRENLHYREEDRWLHLYYR